MLIHANIKIYLYFKEKHVYQFSAQSNGSFSCNQARDAHITTKITKMNPRYLKYVKYIKYLKIEYFHDTILSLHSICLISQKNTKKYFGSSEFYFSKKKDVAVLNTFY